MTSFGHINQSNCLSRSDHQSSSNQQATQPTITESLALELKITEIYPSVQGESSYAGYPCTFVRLTGCPLRCKWCDTAYAFEGGSSTSIGDILDKVRTYELPLVELTGGEPLAQQGVDILVRLLHAAGFKVLIETGGSECIAKVRDHAHIIMDLKCPDSKMTDRMHWPNLDELKATDEIKFVVASRADFDWAMQTIKTYDLDRRFNVLLSPAFGLLKPAELVNWMIAGAPRCRLNLQQHKYIWHPRQKGV